MITIPTIYKVKVSELLAKLNVNLDATGFCIISILSDFFLSARVARYAEKVSHTNFKDDRLRRKQQEDEMFLQS